MIEAFCVGLGLMTLPAWCGCCNQRRRLDLINTLGARFLSFILLHIRFTQYTAVAGLASNT